MAKKSSRKKSSFNFLSVPFIAGILVVLGIVGAIYLNLNGTSVKGTSTFKPPTGINNPIHIGSTSADKCNARVTAFSLSGLCTTSSARDRFTTATYTCSNGTTATITRNCFNAQDAFVKANLNCIKAACPTPSFSPKPAASGHPTGSFPPFHSTNTNNTQ